MARLQYALSLAGFRFRLKVIKGRLEMKMHQFVNRWLVRDCGHYCRWIHPFGFVPEAHCPIHDPDPD